MPVLGGVSLDTNWAASHAVWIIIFTHSSPQQVNDFKEGIKNMTSDDGACAGKCKHMTWGKCSIF